MKIPRLTNSRYSPLRIKHTGIAGIASNARIAIWLLSHPSTLITSFVTVLVGGGNYLSRLFRWNTRIYTCMHTMLLINNKLDDTYRAVWRKHSRRKYIWRLAPQELALNKVDPRVIRSWVFVGDDRRFVRTALGSMIFSVLQRKYRYHECKTLWRVCRAILKCV